MITAKDLKTGTTFLVDGKPYRVVKYSHQKIARGGASVKLSLRNLKTGVLQKKTLNSNTKVEEISTVKRPLQYLYSDGNIAHFMDPKTYELTEISLKTAGDKLSFIKEGENVDVLLWSFGGAQDKEDQPLSVDIPPKVTLSVEETDPGVKGNSATNVYKPAKLENGLKLKVPLFVKVGDKVRVDTRTGEYVERVKS